MKWKVSHGRPYVAGAVGRRLPNFGGHRTPASTLHNTMAGRPMIIVGNAWSLNEMKLEDVWAFPTIGCNRILQMHPTTYYTVVDRDPYRKEIDRIRAYGGTRILSDTLFDPKVSCRRTPIQPPPDFAWYSYHAVATTTPTKYMMSGERVITNCTNDANVTRAVMLDSVCTDLAEFMPGGANIGYCMLQLAIALGANPIGIAGIDLAWQSKDKSHFFGRGSTQGCFPFNTRRVLAFFQAAAQWCQAHGVEVYNLSPTGVLDCFPRMNEHDFRERFEQHILGDSLYPRKLVQPGAGGPLPPLPVGFSYHRHQPHPSMFRPALSAGGGQAGASRGTNQAQLRKAETARLAYARRHARARTRRGG